MSFCDRGVVSSLGESNLSGLFVVADVAFVVTQKMLTKLQCHIIIQNVFHKVTTRHLQF